MGLISGSWPWNQPPPTDLHFSQVTEAAQNSLPFISNQWRIQWEERGGNRDALMFLRAKNPLDVLPGQQVEGVTAGGEGGSWDVTAEP